MSRIGAGLLVLSVLAMVGCDTLFPTTTIDLCKRDNPPPDCSCFNKDVPDRVVSARADICPECQTDPPDPECVSHPDHPLFGLDGGMWPDAEVPEADAGPDGGMDAGDAGDAGEMLDGGLCGDCGKNTPLCDEDTMECVECLEDDDCGGLLCGDAGVCVDCVVDKDCDVAPKLTCEDEDTFTCVECLDDGDCGAERCDTDVMQCVECLDNDDCDAPDADFCDLGASECVECLVHADCGNAAAARCDAGECAACTKDEHCAGVAGLGVCDVGAGECVECTGAKYGACGDDGMGADYVCDSLMRTCSDTRAVGSVGECGSCVADVECGPGRLCVLQQAGAPAEDVGYFCTWNKTSDELDGPNGACINVQPFSSERLAATSLDGVVFDACELETSTCPAFSDYEVTGCTVDAQCGYDSPTDAICHPTKMICTLVCENAADCDSDDTCVTTGVPDYCSAD